MDLKGHVALIGYRASGKSTVSRLLAERLQLPWVDLDAYIEEQTGHSIPEIFAAEGEAGFRDHETQCLQDLCSDSAPHIIATGGGCILRPENCQKLKDTCQHIVYLEAPAAVLGQRLRADAGDRPSLTGAAIDEEVATLLAQREPLYKAVSSDIVDATSSLDELVQTLISIVEN